MPFSKKNKILARVTWFLTFASMKKNKKLNFLVIGVLAFSFLNVVFFASVNNGFANAIDGQLIDFMTGHIVIDPAEEHRYIENWRNTRSKILSFSQVDAVTPELITYAEIKKQDKFRTSTIRGIDPDNAVLAKRLQDKIVGGEFLESNDDDEIILGSDVSGGRYEKDSLIPGVRLGADIGDKVVLTFPNGAVKTFKVKGMYRTSFLGLDAEALIPLSAMEDALNTKGVASTLIVRVQEGTESYSLKQELINSGLSEKVTSWEENAGFSRSVTKSLGLISKITGLIGILTAFVTVFIVIFIKTKNQRGQIATLRAVGISDRAIMGSYIIEAVILGAIGVIIGVFVMKLIILYLSGSPLKLPIGDVVPVLTSELQWKSIALLLLSTLFAGFYPTRKVLQENIIAAIRGGPA